MYHNFGGVLFTTHNLNSGELVPDPTMKRLVYPEWASDPEIFITNTLWDIENEKPLARLGFRHYTGNDPLWSQDGNNVLLLSSIQDQGEEWFDWFLVTADGDVRRITYFTEILKNEVYEVRNASRSWDGRFLVFNFSHKEPTETKIEIILDVQSDPLEGYCFPPPGEKPYSYSYSPLWSPDSKYLLISGEDDEEKEKHLLVDVENQVAYKIEQDMRVIGWIVKP